MKINTAYGLALIVGTVAAIVTMAFHPTGFDPHASVEAVAHEMSILVAVHTLALLSVPLLVFGFVGVTMRAGWHRPQGSPGIYHLCIICRRDHVRRDCRWSHQRGSDPRDDGR